jgi:hypothetical protein
MRTDKDILKHCECAKELNMLEGTRQAAACDLMRAKSEQIGRSESNFPMFRLVKSAHTVQETCLSGAVGSDQAA